MHRIVVLRGRGTPGAHGIEQAALTYFGKPVRDLSDGECAMVVGIIRGPHISSPLRNFDAAIDQRNQPDIQLQATRMR